MILKLIVSIVMMLSFTFTPIGDMLAKDESYVVSAKRYRSGKRSFTPDNRQAEPRSNFTNRRDNNAVNRGAPGANRGGIMRGLLFGGIAGFLLGGLLANMGMLGGILGLLINILAVVLLFSVIRKIYRMFKNNKRENEWR